MNDNNKLIFELIKNNFGYNSESLSYIESQLENHTSSNYIDELFSGFSDERIYYPISLKYKEKIDEGWVMFKKFFMDFASAHEMKYSDFVDNKVTINKNSIKLKKALVAYYIEKRSEVVLKGTINIKASSMMMMENSLSGDKELLYCSAGNIKILAFRENEKGFEFVNRADVALMNGIKKYQHDTSMCSSLSLKSDIQVKTSQCNRILFTSNSDDSEVSFYVNKVSEGGLNFFRRQKLSEEQSKKYFSNKTFLATTNDDRTIKLFYINEDRYFCSVTFLIHQETGDLLFSGELISDLKIDNLVKSLSVVVKEKHSELFLSTLDLENGKSSLVKYITENNVNFVPTTQDLRVYYNTNDISTMFSKEYSYSLHDGNFNIFYLSFTKSSVSDEVKKVIDDDINKKLEAIGAKSLPKNKEISVVISKNFADWFLCSSAETWSSCLNLESHHSSCHWNGLPALLGDKNRVMFYITDGTKKTYKGIVVDKILARTWGLLDDINNFQAIKFYPLEILSMEDLHDITKIPVVFICRSFVSKDPIVPIYYKYNDRFQCSSFIFQDKTQFVLMNDGYHLTFSSSNGFYSLIKDLEKDKESIKPISLFEYTQGLTNLLSRGEKLTSFYKHLSLTDEKCSSCGNRLREGQTSYTIEGEGILCTSCFNDHHFYCYICHNVHSRRELFVSVMDEDNETAYVCENCLDNIVNCSDCRAPVLKKLSIKYRNEKNEKLILCDSCYHKSAAIITTCEHCFDHFHEDVVELNNVISDFRGNIFCGECLFEMADKKQIKFGFFIE